MNGTTPVLILTVAGNVVVQQGLGQNTPTYQVTDSSDGFGSDTESAVDAAPARWWRAGSQCRAPTAATTFRPWRQVPGRRTRCPVSRATTQVIAGVTRGPAYSAPTRRMTGTCVCSATAAATVAVGSLVSVTPAALGVATGIDGRIWVMWGSDNSNLAVTRSNEAVTRFEPIQHLSDRSSRSIAGRRWAARPAGPPRGPARGHHPMLPTASTTRGCCPSCRRRWRSRRYRHQEEEEEGGHRPRHDGDDHRRRRRRVRRDGHGQGAHREDQQQGRRQDHPSGRRDREGQRSRSPHRPTRSSPRR